MKELTPVILGQQYCEALTHIYKPAGRVYEVLSGKKDELSHLWVLYLRRYTTYYTRRIDELNCVDPSSKREFKSGAREWVRDVLLPTIKLSTSSDMISDREFPSLVIPW